MMAVGTDRETMFQQAARDAGWSPDYSIPIQDHAFYKQRSYWSNGDETMDEHELRIALGFKDTAR